MLILIVMELACNVDTVTAVIFLPKANFRHVKLHKISQPLLPCTLM